MGVAAEPFARALRRWPLVLLAAFASTALWLFLREPLSAALGVLATGLVTFTGYETYAHQPDTLAIVVGHVGENAIVRGTTLERWHVNLIALPALVVAFGPARWSRRLALVAAGLAIVFFCDALTAIGFVALQGWGSDPGGPDWLDAAGRREVRQLAMQGLAVYGSKLIPLGVGAGLCLATSEDPGEGTPSEQTR